MHNTVFVLLSFIVIRSRLIQERNEMGKPTKVSGVLTPWSVDESKNILRVYRDRFLYGEHGGTARIT